jgi:DNA-binding transcriptional MerR regulator
MTTYSIKQAAQQIGVSVATLHYYEREGLIWGVTRLPNGHRRFDEQDIAWIAFLTCMRDSGMPIRDLRRYVELSRQKGTARERCELLEKHREAVRAQITLWATYLDRIEAKIDWYHATLAQLHESQEEI